MPKINAGTAHELFAIMDGDRLVMVVAKDPARPVEHDITEQLARLLHHARTSPPEARPLPPPTATGEPDGS